jgi:hypothetical protein
MSYLSFVHKTLQFVDWLCNKITAYNLPVKYVTGYLSSGIFVILCPELDVVAELHLNKFIQVLDLKWEILHFCFIGMMYQIYNVRWLKFFF